MEVSPNTSISLLFFLISLPHSLTHMTHTFASPQRSSSSNIQILKTQTMLKRSLLFFLLLLTFSLFVFIPLQIAERRNCCYRCCFGHGQNRRPASYSWHWNRDLEPLLPVLFDVACRNRKSFHLSMPRRLDSCCRAIPFCCLLASLFPLR